MPLWQQLLWALVGVMFLFFLWPGAKAAMEESRQAENPDWAGALVPIGIVVLFVVVLIYIAKN